MEEDHGDEKIRKIKNRGSLEDEDRGDSEELTSSFQRRGGGGGKEGGEEDDHGERRARPSHCRGLEQANKPGRMGSEWLRTSRLISYLAEMMYFAAELWNHIGKFNTDG
ncbi:unnamed protein product [Linum trigynum]|uniref:Uncharacterized protein n=1 Tax=Linum trigynum TaxID=586398 RepID=A0AAV2C8Q5_9ROSI